MRAQRIDGRTQFCYVPGLYGCLCHNQRIVVKGWRAAPASSDRSRNQQLPITVGVLLLRTRGSTVLRILSHQLTAEAIHLPGLYAIDDSFHAPPITVVAVTAGDVAVRLRLRSHPVFG